MTGGHRRGAVDTAPLLPRNFATTPADSATGGKPLRSLAIHQSYQPKRFFGTAGGWYRGSEGRYW